MLTVTPLQLSWLAPVSFSWSLIPDQESPVPGSISWSTVAGLSVRAKSPVVQAGLVVSARAGETLTRLAVTWCTNTLLELGLVKLPDSVAAGPSGYRPA